ncbi:MAG: FtsX-like permease family protein [Flammeovirgaceae bacterium]|nr:FtsX-like permease family protein [Flammeovirgaceae bacterium]
MLQNYIKVALRSLLKNRIYTLINIVGLSVGLTCFLLLSLHVRDEFSYDDFHTNAENIYQVVLERKYPDHITNYAIVPHSFSDVIVKDFAEVKNAVRILGGGNNTVRVRYVTEAEEEIAFDETKLILADSTFFDIFSFDLISGDKQTVLTKAQSIVLTESTAKKYFGDSDPINKTLNTDFGEFKVTGVCKDNPANSHLEFDFVGSMRSAPFIANNLNYTGFSVYMYLELDGSSSSKSLVAKFPKMVETYAAPQIETNLNTTFKEYVAAGNGYNYYLIPVKDIHLHPVEYQGSMKPGGNINDIYILISIAVLILLIASINFMNLATARSTERGKEVGIRKTMGSHKQQLIFQFLTEAIVTAFIAGIASILFIQLLLPAFNTLIGKSLVFPFDDISLLVSIAGLALGIGILSGFYPAFVLSAFNPVYVLKGSLSSGKKFQHASECSGRWTVCGVHCAYYWNVCSEGSNQFPQQQRFGLR